MARKDLLTRLADAGEDAISKLGESPGMDRMLGFANSTRDRLDELTRRVRGVEELERRIERLEKRLEEMSGTKSSSKGPARSTSGTKRASSTSASSSKGTSRAKGSSAKTGGESPG